MVEFKDFSDPASGTVIQVEILQDDMESNDLRLDRIWKL